MENVIEVEFQPDLVTAMQYVANKHHLLSVVQGANADGTVSVRFNGDLQNLELFIEEIYPGDEVEAYFLT